MTAFGCAAGTDETTTDSPVAGGNVSCTSMAQLKDPALHGLAHYLWPPQWIGAAPAWTEPGPTAYSQSNPSDLGDLIAAAELPEGVRCRVFRDGMLAYEFGPEADFERWMSRGVRLMNAHLACLHAVLDPMFKSSIVTLWNTMQVEFESGTFIAMNARGDGGAALALYFARRPTSVFAADTADWRYSRVGQPISEASIQQSLALLDRLLDGPAREARLLRAELLVRAKVALADLDASGGLTNAWTAVEAMLGDLFRRYLDENADRPVGTDSAGNPLKFIAGSRRSFLGGRDVTVRHTLEFLSLVDRLSFAHYREALRCSKARNEWLHTGKEPAADIAYAAIRLAGELFEILHDVPLHVLGRFRE